MKLEVKYETPDGVVTETFKEVTQISPTECFFYVLDQNGLVWGTEISRVISARRIWDGIAPSTETRQ